MGVSEEMAVFRPLLGAGWFVEDAEKPCVDKRLLDKIMAPQCNWKEERVAMQEWGFS